MDKMKNSSYPYDVSVIVPVYNTEPYLRECLDSLLAQTLERLQVIIVNDGSTDGSQAIIDEYVRAYPQRFEAYMQPNAGQSVARNKGLDVAKGEYVGFFDSDDVAFPQMFGQMYELAKEEDADHVSCGYQNFVATSAGKQEVGRPTLCPDTNDSNGLYGKFAAGTTQHMWRRKVIEGAAIRFHNSIAYEDTAFYLEAIAFVRSTANVPKALIQRRLRAGSLMDVDSSDKVTSIFELFDNVRGFYANAGLNERYGELLEASCVRVLLLSNLARCGLISDARERKRAIDQTALYLGEAFPNRRHNSKLMGMAGLYLKYCPASMMSLAAKILAFRRSSMEKKRGVIA